MKLKALTLFALSAIVFSSCGGEDAKTETVTEPQEEASNTGETLTVNTEKSTINWYGKKAVVAGEHNGTVQLKSGELVMTDGKITGGTFVIDMTTIANNDLAESPEDQKKLVDHLKDDDFFGVKEFPEAKLVITAVGEKSVTADVTIRDKTNTEKFPITVEKGDDGSLTATAEIILNRAKYNVKYGSTSFFDELVDDYIIDNNIKLNVSIVASK